MQPWDGSTLLSPDELKDLIPDLAVKAERDEWERENILSAREWAMRSRTPLSLIVSDEFVRKLHRKMFDHTWRWAGVYRRSEKNIGIPFYQIRERLEVLYGDVRYWLAHATYAGDEIAVRVHHELTRIHPFPNGNGRHARLLADVLLIRLGRPTASWGSANLTTMGRCREEYLASLRAADRGDVQPLRQFLRS